LNLGGLNNYIENYPPDNLDKGFDFTELSAIGVALEDMYGPRGGRGRLARLDALRAAAPLGPQPDGEASFFPRREVHRLLAMRASEAGLNRRNPVELNREVPGTVRTDERVLKVRVAQTHSPKVK